MHLPLIEFQIDFDRNRLLAEAEDQEGYQTFVDPKTNATIPGWYIKRVNRGYAQELTNFFKKEFALADCRPRFYIQDPGVDIGFHIDRQTLCSFNFLLSDDPDPISFRSGTMFYASALLNTTVEHAVLATKNRRVLFKISVFDKSFEEVSSVLPTRLQFR